MNPTTIGWGIAGFLIWSIALSAGSYFKGKAQCELEHDAAQKTHVEQVIDTRNKNEIASNSDASENIKEVEVIKWKTKEVIKNVPIYVSKTSNDKCVLPNGFVRLHDLSASGTGQEGDPNSTGELYDTASEIKLSQAGETIAENYGIYHSEIKRFEGLQKWVSKYCSSK